MSHRARQRKRKKQTGDREKRRRAAGYHYLTIAIRNNRCQGQGCNRTLRKGDELVFRKEPLSILCLDCADKAGVKYRTSKRWEATYPERANAKKRAGREEIRRREANKLDELAERRRQDAAARELERRAAREAWERRAAPRGPERCVPSPVEIRMLGQLGYDGSRPATSHDAQVLISRLLEAASESDEAPETPAGNSSRIS